MSDEADIAQQVIERDLDLSLYTNRLQRPEAYFCGVCLECEEPTEHPKRWCSADCRDKWSLRKQNRIHQ